MNIAGLQPLSFIDFPGKLCSIVFTQGCPFRCSYCHNPELLPFSRHSKDKGDVIEYLKGRRALVDAVCVTGGEPTMQEGLIDFLKTLKQYGFAVKLDTNGVRPDVIEEIIALHLVDYIAMDIKETWEKYPLVIRVDTKKTIESCKKTFSLIEASGIDHEFRTTIMPGVHTPDDFFLIVESFLPGTRYYIQKTSMKKTLEPLNNDEPLDVEHLVMDLRRTFSNITIGYR